MNWHLPTVKKFMCKSLELAASSNIGRLRDTKEMIRWSRLLLHCPRGWHRLQDWERSYIDGVIVGRSDMERGGGDPKDITVAGGSCGSSRLSNFACTYESSFCKLTTYFFYPKGCFITHVWGGLVKPDRNKTTNEIQLPMKGTRYLS